MKDFYRIKMGLFLLDMGMILISYVIALQTILLTEKHNGALSYYWAGAVIFTLFNLVFLSILKVYQSFWKYNQKEEFLRYFLAYLLGAISFLIVGMFAFDNLRFAFKLSALSFLFSFIEIGIARGLYHVIYLCQKKKSCKEKRVLIVGAGEATPILIYDIEKNNGSGFRIVGLVDDDKTKHVRSIPILGNTQDIPSLCEKYQIQEIIIAIPTLSISEKNRILRLCSETSCTVKMIPNMYQIITFNEPLLNQIQRINTTIFLIMIFLLLTSFGLTMFLTRSINQENQVLTQQIKEIKADIRKSNLESFDRILKETFSVEQLTKISKRNLSYSLKINGEEIHNKTSIYLNKPEIIVVIKESYVNWQDELIPKDILAYGSLISKDKIQSIMKLHTSKASYSWEITQAKDGKLLTFSFTNILPGEIVTLELSEEMRKSLKFEDNVVEIFYNKAE